MEFHEYPKALYKLGAIDGETAVALSEADAQTLGEAGFLPLGEAPKAEGDTDKDVLIEKLAGYGIKRDRRSTLESLQAALAEVEKTP